MESTDTESISFGATCEYQYEIQGHIAGGAFGNVYEAYVTKKGSFDGPAKVAVKVIVNTLDESRILSDVKSVEDCHTQLLSLKHCNLVTFYKSTIFQTPGGQSVEFMMEYCGDGNLAALIQKVRNGTLNLGITSIVRCSVHIGNGLSFLHSKQIIHGDLKPANVVINYLHTKREIVKICDLDSCVQMRQNATVSQDITHGIGTVRYMSPEMLRKHLGLRDDGEVIGRKTDIWSLGCIITELLNCSAALQDRLISSTEEVMDIPAKMSGVVFAGLIVNGWIPFVQCADPPCNRDTLSACIRRCLTPIHERISAGDLTKQLQEHFFAIQHLYNYDNQVAFQSAWEKHCANFRINGVGCRASYDLTNPSLPKRLPVGISMGATYSCIAVYREGNGCVEVIENDRGQRLTRSAVRFDGEDNLVGTAATEHRRIYPDNTVDGVKRILGRSFHDPLVQSDMLRWRFTVVDDNGKPCIRIVDAGSTTLVTPEKIIEILLKYLKNAAKDFLHSEVFDTVLTVPAYFTDYQRQAMVDAAKGAEWNVTRIISEPVAAATACAMAMSITYPVGQKILVFDLGSSTLDISILSAAPSMEFRILSAYTDPQLGGQKFNDALAEFLLTEFTGNNHLQKTDLQSDSVLQLNRAVQLCKRTLSFREEYLIQVPKFHGNQLYQRNVHRADFDHICRNIFDRIISAVGAALAKSGDAASSIDNIVLVGGSSVIPKIKALLKCFFPGKPILQEIYPAESVARGAAIYAAGINGQSALAPVF
ncbi:heat shock 70 kDa protein 1A-like [Paramacrobiotus metropolitanus]|uniref:heat shock 70 kDa protein 1A-like n=1 Tax=Paramacrobiotus metropolitanus TaxID=2943436 RepID=UPI0024456119|nr:heat shock 70 kDa protein 1A-like [Paramacrobiotus metropolitanus]XP_055349140.1 heat shock 70 kDa protein 1A-like [Paramacrobiotus metropolitanus]XP_055349141.1 heat shock 70 kDa protein 1A-like [Paramacrobiotus metropolitanus]